MQLIKVIHTSLTKFCQKSSKCVILNYLYLYNSIMVNLQNSNEGCYKRQHFNQEWIKNRIRILYSVLFEVQSEPDPNNNTDIQKFLSVQLKEWCVTVKWREEEIGGKGMKTLCYFFHQRPFFVKPKSKAQKRLRSISETLMLARNMI